MMFAEQFLAADGSWTGKNHLRLSWLDPSDFYSDATLEFRVLEGRSAFFLAYTWKHEEKDHEGGLLVVVNSSTGAVTAGWTDSWHQKASVMLFEGEILESGEISLLGSYPAPPGPDWGWRILLEVVSPTGFRMRMFNIPPGESEDLAVDAVYSSET